LWDIHVKQEGPERQKRFYKWKYVTLGGVYSSPALNPAGTMLFVGSWDRHLHAIRTSDGIGAWTFSTGDFVYSSPTVSSDGATVYVCSTDKKIYAVQASDGTKKWEYLTGGPIVGSPALSADGLTLYGGSADSLMYAINTIDGTKKWVYHTLTGYFIDSSPAVNGNFVYMGSSDSSLYGIQDAGKRAFGSLDQSWFGNGECERNCVPKVNKTKRPNITLWLLEDAGVARSLSLLVEMACLVVAPIVLLLV
jgi:outer membrane protein assembly factor BamB